MADRIAGAVQGLCSLAALIIGAFAVYMLYVSGGNPQATIVVGMGAGLIWGAGRAARYVIAGK